MRGSPALKHIYRQEHICLKRVSLRSTAKHGQVRHLQRHRCSYIVVLLWGFVPERSFGGGFAEPSVRVLAMPTNTR